MTGLGAGAAMLAALALPDSANAQDGKNKLLAAYEEPAHIEEVIDRFRACVDEATAITTPAALPDPALRADVFNAMVDQCEELKQSEVRILNANASIEARTRSIIDGAKRENDIPS